MRSKEELLFSSEEYYIKLVIYESKLNFCFNLHNIVE